jgi:hypothetical protein
MLFHKSGQATPLIQATVNDRVVIDNKLGHTIADDLSIHHIHITIRIPEFYAPCLLLCT